MKKRFISVSYVLLAGCASSSVYAPTTPSDPYARPAVIPVPQRTHSQDSMSFPAVRPKAEIAPPVTPSTHYPAMPFVAKPLSAPVLALMADAEHSINSGDLDSAVVTVERALRIEPRNPKLTYELAALRLKQSKPRLAEDLAKKAALLAGNDKQLKKNSWLLISEARIQQQKFHAAQAARLKANSF